MSYGTLVLGKLVFEIRQIDLRDGKLFLRTVAKLPKRKHIPVSNMLPYSIYGEDGKLVAVGSMNGAQFKDAHDSILGGNLYLDLPVEFHLALTEKES